MTRILARTLRGAALTAAGLGLAVLGSGCAAHRTFVASGHGDPPAAPAPDAAYEVFLLGNTADGSQADLDRTLDALRAELDRAGEASAVVFLGDVTAGGLPEAGSDGWDEANARLRALAAAVDGYEGRVVIVPGNRDWARGEDGVERLEAYVEALMDRGDVVAPGDARSGPLVLPLDDGLTLVALDTAWWLTDESKPDGDAARFDGDAGDYEAENAFEVVVALEDALRGFDPDEENVLVVGHHPLMSNGEYGGHFTLGRHLTPLPVLGSAYPLYRQFVGEPQDLASPRYRSMRQALEAVFLAFDGVVYAAAHDRSLQVFPIEESIRRTQYYLVSGSAADGDPVVSGRGAALASSERGFMRIRYHGDGAADLDVIAVDPGSGAAAPLFSHPLFEARALPARPPVPDPDALPAYGDSTVTAAINPGFEAGPFKRFALGAGYRDAWTTPVPFPVLDFSAYGGLTPTQSGGGMQTLSLRLEDPTGQEYVVRLLNKVPGRTLPEELRRSVVADIIQDLGSATIPWGSLSAAALAEATGLYHTNPRLVYVPDDPRLGPYRETFGGQLALFEERPDDDMSDVPSFGRSSDVVSSADLIAEIEGDNDHRVDQRFFLRSRLLDVLLSDWDRHLDQWRWASFEPFELDPSLSGDAREEGKVYRAIPRDRDFAFYNFSGFVPFVARKIEPKFQSFEPRYGNLQGLTKSGIPLDRRFTNRLTREEWLAEARSFQADLSDPEVEAAIRLWPDAIYDRYAERTLRVLRQRRDRIVDAAEEIYDFYAADVDVVGSNKRERFDVTRRDGGAVEVVVYDSNDDGDRNEERYRRVLDPRETGEVRLYGLDGGDFFTIAGDGGDAIRVRVIGGAGEDTFSNEARGGGVVYYDTEDGNTIDARGGAAVVLSDRPENNRYDPVDYVHPDRSILIRPGYNRTDGVVLGGGLAFYEPGFRRHPWASVHAVSASVATQTGGVRGGYAGRYYDVFGPDWDGQLSLTAQTPRYVRNFYGLGNETGAGSAPSSFFHVDLLTAEAEAALIRRVEALVQARFGLGVHYFDVAEDPERLVGTAAEPGPDVAVAAFEGQAYARPFFDLTLQNVDVEVNPRQGFRWASRAALFGGLNGAADTFGAFASDLAFYFSPSLSPQLTLATRVGGGHNVGDFPFFLAQTLGGNENVRGLVRQRYSGRSALYQNAELRLKLFDAFGYVLPTDVGLLGFVDNGRVWADGEYDESLFEGWHQGYGGGLWFGVLDRFIATTAVASGDDGVLFDLSLRFLY